MDIEKRALECRGDRKKESAFIMEMDPFVRKTVSRYAELFPSFRDDIYTAAEYGLYKALKNFDFNYKGFVRYAKKSMEMEIRLVLSNDTRLIRLPRYVTSVQKKILDYTSLHPEADEENVKREVGIKSGKTYRTVRDSVFLRSVVSLDSSPFLEKGDDKDESGGIIEEELPRALDSLSFPERYIVDHTFGLGGNEKFTLSRIAGELGVSKQTVITRRKKAYSSLKASLSSLMT